MEKVNVKYVIRRLWHEIFHIVTGINPRPISALQLRCRGWYGSLGLIPGPIWKMSCNNLLWWSYDVVMRECSLWRQHIDYYTSLRGMFNWIIQWCYPHFTILHQYNRGRLLVCKLERFSGVETRAILSVAILLMFSHFSYRLTGLSGNRQ